MATDYCAIARLFYCSFHLFASLPILQAFVFISWFLSFSSSWSHMPQSVTAVLSDLSLSQLPPRLCSFPSRPALLDFLPLLHSCYQFVPSTIHAFGSGLLLDHSSVFYLCPPLCLFLAGSLLRALPPHPFGVLVFLSQLHTTNLSRFPYLALSLSLSRFLPSRYLCLAMALSSCVPCDLMPFCMFMASLNSPSWPVHQVRALAHRLPHVMRKIIPPAATEVKMTPLQTKMPRLSPTSKRRCQIQVKNGGMLTW